MARRKKLNAADPTARDAVGNASKSDPRILREDSWEAERLRRHARAQARAKAVSEAIAKKQQVSE
jgi:hypothetical protein